MRKPISIILTTDGKREPKTDEIMIKDLHSKAVIIVKIEDIKDYSKEDWQDLLIKLASHPAIGWTFHAIWTYAEDKDKLFNLYIKPALRRAGLI
jgi:hypothetical protein